MYRDDMTDQIRRIAQMEAYLDEIAAAQKALDAAQAQYDAALARCSAAEAKFAELTDYYEGPLWRQDFEDDEAGKLPRDLKRGVLTEDAVYDLLAEDRRLTEQLEAHRRQLDSLLGAAARKKNTGGNV